MHDIRSRFRCNILEASTTDTRSSDTTMPDTRSSTPIHNSNSSTYRRYLYRLIIPTCLFFFLLHATSCILPVVIDYLRYFLLCSPSSISDLQSHTFDLRSIDPSNLARYSSTLRKLRNFDHSHRSSFFNLCLRSSFYRSSPSSLDTSRAHPGAQLRRGPAVTRTTNYMRESSGTVRS